MSYEPIKMVLISGLSVVALTGILFFYIKILGKKISYPVLIFLISLLPLVSMLRLGTYESGDLSIHASFAIPFFQSLKEGIFFPVWDNYMLDGYGYPYFLFSYPLPYYLTSLVHLLGFSFINSLKIIASLSFILSGFGMYILTKEVTKKDLTAFISAIFYLFAPYHLVDLHFRFAIGELLAFAVLPFCFYFLKRTKKSGNYLNFFGLSLSFGALILSHQAISLISGIFLTIFTLYFYLDDKNLKNGAYRVVALVGGAVLTSFYWVPVLMESKYTHLLQRVIEFQNWIFYIFSPSRFGLLYQGNTGELYFPIGYIHLPTIMITICLLLIPFGKRFLGKEYRLIFILITAFLIAFFMMLPVSAFLWKSLPLINGFQFSYRFSLFCAFFSSLIVGIILSKIKNIKLIYLLLIAAILTTILNWGNRRTIPQITDKVLIQELYKSTIPVGPGTTIWTDVDDLPKRNADINLKSGSSSTKEIKRNSTTHEYLIEVKSDSANFVENTLYFPGWRINVNGSKMPINVNELRNGLIGFSLPNGLHSVTVEFESTSYQVLGKLLSFTALIGLCIPLIGRSRKS